MTVRTIVDINILQSVPPSNLNRDDSGSPKTAHYGGTERARVSSQAWKSATRFAFNQKLDPSSVGFRTKQIVVTLAERIREQQPTIEEAHALELAKKVLEKAGVKLTTPRAKKGEEARPDEADALFFISSRQLDLLAEIAVTAAASDDIDETIKSAEPKKKLNTEHSVDIGLFGRMVASAPDLNVDAAVQVAHAISVHPVRREWDYFTAVDDIKSLDDSQDAGAAMIGTVEFNSATLYRYATVDVDRLRDNLGDDEATARAVHVFVEAFATSMPTGKQNSHGNRTLPDAIVVSVRDSQSVNLVGAFESHIGRDFLATASSALAKRSTETDEKFGTTPVQSWVVRIGEDTEPLAALGEDVGLDTMTSALADTVRQRLATAAGR
jgi:CRISPR system Cascade subunit CasC